MLNELLTRGIRRLSFGGKEQLIEYTCPKHGTVVADVFGYHVKLDLADPVQRRMYCGTYKSDQFALLCNYIRRGMTFVDVGTNIGYYTLLFASFEQEYVGDGTFDQDYLGDPGRVYAFDPSLYAGNRLTETINNNDLLNVHFQSVALGDVAGERTIYVSREQGHNKRSMLPFAGSIPIRSQVKRLDDALEAQGIQKVDLLRVDVNGYESNVLEGAAQYLKERRIAAILCAFDGFWLEKNGSSREALYELLSSYGYGSSSVKVALDTGEKSALLVLKP